MFDGVALVVDDGAAAADPAGVGVLEGELAVEEHEFAFVFALGGQAGLGLGFLHDDLAEAAGVGVALLEGSRADAVDLASVAYGRSSCSRRRT